MSQSGFTPIQLYRSATAATLPVAGNLAAGELAINTTDEKLYFENTGGTVTLLASSAAAGGTFTTVTATTVVNGLGAVGTPSYTFTGDLNTGMWSPAADTVAVSTAGAERLRVTSAGLVGIGNTAPNTTLDVSGSITSRSGSVIADTLTNYGANLVINAAGSLDTIFQTNGTERMRLTTGGIFLVGATSSLGVGVVRTQIGSASAVTAGLLLKSTTASLSLYAASGTVSYQAWKTGGDMAFGTGPDNLSTFAEAMRITSTGLVGLGTTAPSAQLTVIPSSNPATATGTLQTAIGEATNNSAYQMRMGYTGTYQGVINVITGGAGAELLLNPSGGAVGIATSAPLAPLDIAANLATFSATGNSILRLNNVASNGQSPLDFVINGTLRGRLRSDFAGNMNYVVNGGSHTFWTGGDSGVGNTRMTLDATTLDINANAKVPSGSSFYWGDATSQITAVNAGAMRFLAGTASEKMRIEGNGDVGIGTTAPATGSMSNVAILNAGMFTTFRGVVTAANNTATTIAVASSAVNATYIVCCGIASADPVNFSAVAIVSGDLGVYRTTTLQTANLMAISVSGTNIRATQNAGGAATVAFSITRIS